MGQQAQCTSVHWPNFSSNGTKHFTAHMQPACVGKRDLCQPKLGVRITLSGVFTCASEVLLIVEPQFSYLYENG